MKKDPVTRRFQITNTTTPETLDTFFTELWRTEPKVHLLMDTTGCDISLGKALSLKQVLNKHRNNSKRYIDHTTLLVKSSVVSTILKTALFVLRPERPVRIEVANKKVFTKIPPN